MVARAIALPAPAYRRSWLAARLEHIARNLVFDGLLRELAPAVYAALPENRPPMDVYYALTNYIDSHLFPVYAGIDFDWAEEEEEINAVGEAIYFGIPVDTLGYEEDSLYDDRGSPCLGLMFIATHDVQDNIRQMRCLHRYLPSLELRLRSLFTQPAQGAQIVAKNIQPPRGREWRPVWQGLPELFDYIICHTGNAFLDYSNNDVDEMGNNPRWHIEEIRGLADEYAEAKPIWARIQKLIKYVDDDPVRRLPLLLEVLTGHEATRQKLSRPKPAKTLMDVLK